MAKKARRKRKARARSRETNWYVIGGVIAIGIVALFALLYLATRTDSGVALLGNYCNSQPENCVAKGNPDSDLTIVEIVDYGCGVCANFTRQKDRTLNEMYVTSNKVNWVVMPYALRGQSGQFPTLPTTVSAMCANEQGRFFDYHSAVFDLQGTPLFNTEEGFVQTATSLGMDVTAFSSCLANNDYTDIVLHNIDMAGRAGVRSTPSFFINDRLVSGDLPSIADYQRIIDRELNQPG